MRYAAYIVTAAILISTAPGSTLAREPDRVEGRRLFLRACSPCHGDSGLGNGPNASLFLSRPRNLRDGFVDKYSVDALVDRVMKGKQLELGLNLPELRKHARETAGVEKHLKRIATLDWGLVQSGWGIYVDRCEACHGPFGKPTEPLSKGVRPPRDLAAREFQEETTDTQLLQAVRHGSKGMPALIPRLRPEQGESVAAFIRMLSPGFKTYSLYCGQCHGDDGIGYGNYEDSEGTPTVVFDSAYFETVSPLKLRESAWHMLRTHKPSMPHFRGSLSRAEAALIIRYLKSLPRVMPRTPPSQ